MCPQLAAEIQTPSSNSWGYPDNSLLMWAGSWGAVGWVLGCCGLAKSCSKHLAWGGHHHKPELIAVCTSQRQSPVIKQGGIRSWHYCIQPGTDEDTKLGAEWESHRFPTGSKNTQASSTPHPATCIHTAPSSSGPYFFLFYFIFSIEVWLLIGLFKC